MKETGYVLWHSLSESGEIEVYDIEWESGKVETNIPAIMLEVLKDSDLLGEVHEAHGAQSKETPKEKRKYKPRS